MVEALVVLAIVPALACLRALAWRAMPEDVRRTADEAVHSDPINDDCLLW
jgi:hypothetical protein